MNCRLFCLIILLLPGLSATTQSYIGLREVINYKKLDYNAGAQNWDVRQDANGIIYFANNEGLLTFDGVHWKVFPQPNKTIVRSIELGSQGRIYTGGQDEIGYFEPSETGKLSYHSLKPLLPEADNRFADIWDIVRQGEEIFFRSTDKIFRYTGSAIQVFPATDYWLYIGIHNKELIAQDQQKGLLQFKSGQWVTYLPKSAIPSNFEIIGTAPIGQDSSIVATSNHGLYTLAPGGLSPLSLTGMNIPSPAPFSSMALMDKDHFILGTYTNGFYLVDKNGRVIENFSRREGLQNSNIRSVFMDRNRNIWLGLESGIDFIAFNNSIKHINPPIMNDGAGFAVLIFNQQLYFGLSNGIFQLPLPGIRDLSYAVDNFKTIVSGQTWGLSVVNDMLLAGRGDGFWQIRDGIAIPVVKGRGFWTFQNLKDLQASTIVAGNYEGVRVYESGGGTLTEKGTVEGFTESARFLEIDNDNSIWVSHPYRGIYRIQLTSPIKSQVKLYTQAHGLPSSLQNHVFKVRNRVVIATERGIYEYNARSDSFQVSGYFKEIFGERGIRYLKEDPSGNIWFIQEKNIGVVDFSSVKPTIIYLPELKGKMLSGFEYIYPVNDNNIFVGGEKGFYHINFEKYKENKPALNVYIRTVKSIGKADSLLYDGNVTEKIIPSVTHQNNSFHIEYSSPLYEQAANLEYSYYLEGFDKDWSEWTRKTEKDYTNLPAGDYVFNVKVRNNLLDESESAVYRFTVLPPWYLTIWAWIMYALIAIWIAFLLYRKQRRKLLRERQKHMEEQKRLAYLHQLEMEKSEKELVKLKNEKLETEIGFKNTELASTAMHLVQKAEFLLKIKDELHHLTKAGKDKSEQPDVKKLLRILSEEEKLNEEWEQFSVHFDKVHSDFLITLKEKYPNLSAHELKLCAYLRMNLSSKEIAQLMSISVRGVEISRYRLRKKLQLPTETNLFQFLFDIHRINSPSSQS
ncbi:MAG: transcriptional regulator [Gemmatimonadaceae bacterium]|nr:transcriptional regulator [Chitinophagaceae bacterium]